MVLHSEIDSCIVPSLVIILILYNFLEIDDLKLWSTQTSDVLSSVADSGFVDTKACEPRFGPDACYVHASVFDWIFLGEEAVHDMQPSIFSSSIPNMLQRHRELSLLVCGVRQW